MTGRTHDLAALTTLTYYIANYPLIHMSLATALVAVGANMLGAVTPDLDQPTADLWRKFPAGSLIGRLITPLLGSHRITSHSLFGLGLFGFLLKYALLYIRKFLIVDISVVWWAFMLGYFSHLVMDTITKEGVPWLFPIPIRFGFPPLKLFRLTTGGMLEKGIIYPGLLLTNGYLVYMHYGKFIEFIRGYIAR